MRLRFRSSFGDCIFPTPNFVSCFTRPPSVTCLARPPSADYSRSPLLLSRSASVHERHDISGRSSLAGGVRTASGHLLLLPAGSGTEPMTSSAGAGGEVGRALTAPARLRVSEANGVEGQTGSRHALAPGGTGGQLAGLVDGLQLMFRASKPACISTPCAMF